jgi:hypothetical protein
VTALAVDLRVNSLRKFSTSQRQEIVVANTGSVGLSYDGDGRASYLLLDDLKPTIRRVEYDLEKELDVLSTCGLPHADWIARTLRTASPQCRKNLALLWCPSVLEWIKGNREGAE